MLRSVRFVLVLAATAAAMLGLTGCDATAAVAYDVLTPFEISGPGQAANFTFKGSVGQRVTVVVPNGGSLCEGASFFRVGLVLYRPDGVQMASGYGCRDVGIEHVRLPASGTYRVRVDPSGDYTGSAVFVVYRNNDSSVASVINTPVPFSVKTPGQLASFTFPALSGQYFSVRYPDAGTLCSTDVFHNIGVTLLRPDGSTAVSGFGCSALAIDHHLASVGGTYTVRIDADGGRLGAGEATVYRNIDTLVPTTSGSAKPITISTPGQVAEVSIAGVAGQFLSAEVPNAGTLCESSVFQAVDMRLYKPDGTSVLSGHGCAAAGIVNYHLPVSGTYRLRVDPKADVAGLGSATVTLTG